MLPLFSARNRRVQVAGLSAIAASTSLYFSGRTMSSIGRQANNIEMPWNGQAVPYKSQHKEWPYTDADFKRMDESIDSSFYSAPRFVTHIDDAAIASLRSYYATVLPNKGRILDLCSSWISHYPESVEQAAKSGDLKIVGLGMNQAELEKNQVLSKRILQDLNIDPNIPLTVCDESKISGMKTTGPPGNNNASSEDGLLDATTCVVSLDYLTSPREVLSSLKELTRTGGRVEIIVSSRMFPTKATSSWVKRTPEQRLQMVGDYLHFAGWKDIEIVDIKAGDPTGAEEGADSQGGLQGFMAMMGMGGNDPLWSVRASKRD